jgi:5'-nucleotidase / UDP-sugar diphosphatase
MKNILRTYRSWIFAISIIVVLASCKSLRKKQVSELPSLNEPIEFVIVQLNDVYEIAPLSGGKYGGMARVAHIRDSIKAQEPNTFLMMAGDFLNPSLLGTLKYQGERVKGKHMIEVMNAMDFDLATFGNHEFDLSEDEFQQRLNEATFPWTTANVYQVTEDGNRSFSVYRDNDTLRIPETYQIPIIRGDSIALKVGLFSVTIDSNPVDYVYYSDYLLESKTAIQTLQAQGIDLILGLTHLDIDQDIQLSESLTTVPFIMGGHEHNSMLVETDFATIAKADANAKTIYIHRFSYDPQTKELQVNSTLVPVDDTVPSQPQTHAVVEKWNSILEKQIKEVIPNPYEEVYQTEAPLDGTDVAGRSLQTNLGSLITAGMSYAYDNSVDAAFVNGGSFRLDDVLTGSITSIDIFRVLPFGGSVYKVKLKGSLLIDVLNYGIEQRGTGAYLQRHLLISENDTWSINGEPILPNKTYTIATSDFLLKGYDIPFLTKEHPGIVEIYEPNENEIAFDIRKAVILYLKNL